MNTPGGHPPAKTLTIFGLRSIDWIFFWTAFCFRTWRDHQRGCWGFSCLNALKNKALPLPGHFDRFKIKWRFVFSDEKPAWVRIFLLPIQKWFHVDSQIKDSKILPIVFVVDIPVKASMPNLAQPYQKTLMWNVQEQTCLRHTQVRSPHLDSTWTILSFKLCIYDWLTKSIYFNLLSLDFKVLNQTSI